MVILTIEATPLTQWGPCQPYTEKIAEKTVNFKYWQRTIFYGVSGCLVYFFCTASAIVNVAVFLLTMLVAFIYGFVVFKHKRMVSVFSIEYCLRRKGLSNNDFLDWGSRINRCHMLKNHTPNKVPIFSVSQHFVHYQ